MVVLADARAVLVDGRKIGSRLVLALIYQHFSKTLLLSLR